MDNPRTCRIAVLGNGVFASRQDLSEYDFFNAMPRSMSSHGDASTLAANGHALFVVRQVVLHLLLQIVRARKENEGRAILQPRWYAVHEI